MSHPARSVITYSSSPNLSDFDSSSLFALHDRLLDARPSVVRAFGDRLIARNARYPIVVLCTVMMIFAIWGCVNIRVDMREEFFLPSASPARRFLEGYREMFGKTTQFIEVNFDDAVEYNVEEIRDSIFELLDGAVNAGYASRVISWLTDFAKFEKSTIYDINEDTFVPVVNLVFLETDPYKRFVSDISFDRHQTQIIRSRMYLELTQKGVKDRHNVALQIPYFLVLMETIGYATHWNVPINIITVTVALSANMLASVIAMAFGYSYSVSGKQQMRAGVRIQYTFQATFLPVVFACLVPVITYLPLFAVDAPIILHIWKILLISSAATLTHYILFIPNLCLLFSNQLPAITAINCTECCCDIEDDSSIYYIPTTARTVHPEGCVEFISCPNQYFLTAVSFFQHISTHLLYIFGTKIGSKWLPPNYLAITGPPIAPTYVGDYIRTHMDRPRTRRAANMNESSATSETATPRQQRTTRKISRDDSIYEAPPSPVSKKH
ncbi:putative ATP synthase F0, A subunit [Dictyocaulus viviparus]|uniref:Putative ATP synthase F0, A subunit n=1 Tax=Dictyocaulus viviparus TaxID=29172 RepID=A0A0D8XG03_DICVI|nr:putative ATP synthase F0, A subunit [Dictyocaulus viviparus]